MIRDCEENEKKLNLQIEFATHPLLLYFSDINDVFLSDLRGKNLNERFLLLAFKIF